MHVALCVCSLVPTLATRTKLLLVLHKDEERKTTNTGQLAARCLPNSEIVIVGDRERPLPEPLFGAHEQPLLLFPSDEAVPLVDAAATLAGPATLVVPDGNWRQASKARARIPGLSRVPCVSLPDGSPTAYRLRAEPREGGLATLEAIARALAVLESAAVADAMLAVFRVMVERTLWSRGALRDDEVTGGVPVGARRG